MFFYHGVAIIGYSPPVIHAQLAVDQSNLHDYFPDKLPDGFDVVKTRSSLKKHQEFRSNKDVTFPRCYIAANTLLTVYLFIILMYKKLLYSFNFLYNFNIYSFLFSYVIFY
jgi:hypothetical protein